MLSYGLEPIGKKPLCRRLKPVTTGLPYLRRRRLWLAVLVLPALVFRAVVPFGFMPVVEGGGVTIGFCPGEGTLPPGIAAAHHSHAQPLHHHAAATPGGAAGDPADPGPATHDAPCLFAASAAPAFAPAFLALAVPVVRLARIERSAATEVFPPSILRAQSSRGPPHLV
jgi:hypothetical protein